MWYMYFVNGELFSNWKKMFLNDRMVRLTRISCISAYKSNSFNSCEVANEILSELLVI